MRRGSPVSLHRLSIMPFPFFPVFDDLPYTFPVPCFSMHFPKSRNFEVCASAAIGSTQCFHLYMSEYTLQEVNEQMITDDIPADVELFVPTIVPRILFS